MATPLSTRLIAEDEARAIVEAVAQLPNKAAWPAVIELLRRPKPPGNYRMSIPRANFLRDRQIWPMRVAARRGQAEDPEARALRLAERRAELAAVALPPREKPASGDHGWRPAAPGALVSVEPARFEPEPAPAPEAVTESWERARWD